MRLRNIQCTLKAKVCISIQYTKHFVEVLLPADCSLNNATRMCDAAVSNFHLGLGPKIKGSLLQIAFS
ncbi:hypothetical protein D3C80_511930 [compost metagenome]